VDLSTESMVKLQNGFMLKDFIDPMVKKIKFYKYNAGRDADSDAPNEDIRITLTSEKNEFQMFVFLDDYYNYSYDTNTGIVTGYKWKSNYNNEVIISKTDPDYKHNGNYYILVVFNHGISAKSYEYTHTGSYYLVVTNEEVPIYLHEGFPHSVTLNNKDYIRQNYYYNHYNTSLPCKIDVNSNGHVDINIGIKNSAQNDLQEIVNKTNAVSQ